MNLFDTPEDLAKSGYVFRITDNRGETLDRYTLMFSDGDFLSLSENGLGVSMWGEGGECLDYMSEGVRSGELDDLRFDQLSEALQGHILARVNEAFRDALETPRIAENREAAGVFEGRHDQAGVGIYQAADGLRIRDAEHEDPGPFATYRYAFRATLPEPYSLAGPEYHSGADTPEP